MKYYLVFALSSLSVLAMAQSSLDLNDVRERHINSTQIVELSSPNNAAGASTFLLRPGYTWLSNKFSSTSLSFIVVPNGGPWTILLKGADRKPRSGADVTSGLFYVERTLDMTKDANGNATLSIVPNVSASGTGRSGTTYTAGLSLAKPFGTHGEFEVDLSGNWIQTPDGSGGSQTGTGADVLASYAVNGDKFKKKLEADYSFPDKLGDEYDYFVRASTMLNPGRATPLKFRISYARNSVWTVDLTFLLDFK